MSRNTTEPLALRVTARSPTFVPAPIERVAAVDEAVLTPTTSEAPRS